MLNLASDLDPVVEMPGSASEAAARQELIVRLHRVEGQIKGIQKMVEKARPCLELLQQLAAAEAALNRIGLEVFRHHVRHCVPDALMRSDADGRASLSELVDIFDRFAR